MPDDRVPLTKSEMRETRLDCLRLATVLQHSNRDEVIKTASMFYDFVMGEPAAD